MRRRGFISPPWRGWRWERSWSARTASATGPFASQVSTRSGLRSDSTIWCWTQSVRSRWRHQRRRHYGAAGLKPHAVIASTPSVRGSTRCLPILMPFGRAHKRIGTLGRDFDLPHRVAEFRDHVGVCLTEGVEVVLGELSHRVANGRRANVLIAPFCALAHTVGSAVVNRGL